MRCEGMFDKKNSVGFGAQFAAGASWELRILDLYLYPNKGNKNRKSMEYYSNHSYSSMLFLVISLMISTEASRFGPVGGRGASAAKTMDVFLAWF